MAAGGRGGGGDSGGGEAAALKDAIRRLGSDLGSGQGAIGLVGHGARDPTPIEALAEACRDSSGPIKIDPDRIVSRLQAGVRRIEPKGGLSAFGF